MSTVLPEIAALSVTSPLASLDRQYRLVFDAVNDGIFISNPVTGRFVEVNQSGCTMFGYDKGELIGCEIGTLSSGIHPYTHEMAVEKANSAFLGEPQIFEWQCKTKNDDLFWAEVTLRYTQFGPTPAIVANVRNITERKKLHAQLEHMAHHDALTGLANRSVFTAALDQAIAHSRGNGDGFAVLLLDLDHFKDVNDTRGHPTGDRLLRIVAERLQDAARSSENVFRLSGDEFAILLRGAREQAELGAFADQLIASISRPFLMDGLEVHVGASIGVALYGEDTCDADALMSHADTALYRAKAEGRQICRFYSAAMKEAVQSRTALAEDLRLAIPGGQLFLAYQPQVTGKDGRIVGVEALVRWQHPRLGVLAPVTFLPMAESSGLSIALDRWVLREACRQGRQWLDAGVAPGKICVNLSSAQFKQPLELEAFVLAVLDETGLPARFLELEITESTLVGFSSAHGEVIKRLRHIGVSFALDDFGTGYSSLNYLRLFAVDRIKIAREFVADLESRGDVASIVKCIVNLAQALGNDVMAEGVETSEQHELLQEWGCPDIQGHYFACPMTAEAISPLLSAGAISPSSLDCVERRPSDDECPQSVGA